MNWDFLLSRKERDSYDYYLELFLSNIRVFLFSVILAYILLTLTFFQELTAQQHFWYFVIVTAYVVFVYQFINASKPDGSSSRQFEIWRVLLVLILWTVLVNSYFYFIAQSNNELLIVMYVMDLAVFYLVRVALVGQFTRINLISTVISVLWISVVVWDTNHVIYWNSAIQGYLLVCFLMIFLYAYNNQLSVMFKVQNQNSHLVDTLKSQNIALEKSNLSQSRYLSAASHDLRQPLHALALLTTDALRKTREPHVANTLVKIDQAIDSLSQSFNAVLNLSRLDAGVVKPEFSAVSLQHVLKRISAEFDEVALQKGLVFKIVSTEVWVISDEGMLHSILSNFVSNAIRYTEKGKVLICVRRAGKGMIRVLVYDTGVGVPTEKASQIFQEYQRLEYAEQRVKGGVGLGLAISERMARLLDVQLYVRSQVGKGSCFGLMLPIVAASEASSQVYKEREQLSDLLFGKRVAILEDNEVAVDYLYTMLSDWGLDVSIILSSDMLQETIAEDGPFDLILSDYHLSLIDETGLDVLILAQKIQLTHAPKCILITGDTSSELSNAAQRERVKVLYKPIRPVRLRSYLNSLFLNS